MGQYDRNVADVHQEISEEAASIANAEVDERAILPFGAFGVFQPKHYELGLVVNQLIEDPKLIIELRKIAQEALQKAVAQRPDLIVGLIVGDARKGRNYFARFA